ncbi:hypothetical protein [Primorskyibacter flagellatus]|uniref:Uncharacterized protein n=1 Tax=Primorskyibacter flagellatus TaxID=1387277 RepID=A0A1W2EMX2_9RHOB|nr:hypothetical protein [Primorskyibacter flagellatus]SMD10636.1 hypothetical protein SAMN06295998_1336 [Primorskyibacter flagellatus]
MSEQRKRAPLSEVFRKAMTTHDNNMPVAFIAVLDEIDRRDALIEADMIENAGLFNVMAEELGTVGEKQDSLPAQIRLATEQAIVATLPHIRRESLKGAREAADPGQRAVERLERAADAHVAYRERLSKLALLGLPAAFGVALMLGLFFGSIAIPALPASWQWTCKLIGAEHITQDSGQSFCFVRK